MKKRDVVAFAFALSWALVLWWMNMNANQYTQVVVMQNIFYQRNVNLVFDLKGSTRSRYVRPEGQDGSTG